MPDTYTISLDGGKYTVINEWGMPLQFLRHGETWPAANNLKHDKVVLAMAQRIEELEVAIKDVLDGPLLHSSRRDALSGMAAVVRNFDVDNLHRVEQWEQRLRNVLEPTRHVQHLPNLQQIPRKS